MRQIPFEQLDFFIDVFKQNYDDCFYLESKTVVSRELKVLDNRVVYFKKNQESEVMLVPNDYLYFESFPLLVIDEENGLYSPFSLDDILDTVYNRIYPSRHKHIFITTDSNRYLEVPFNEIYPDFNEIADAFISELKQNDHILNHWLEIEQEIVDGVIKNSVGLVLNYKEVRNKLRLTVLVKSNGFYNSASVNTVFKSLPDLNIPKIIADLVNEAKTVYKKLNFNSGHYDILFSNKAVSNLLPHLVCRFLTYKPSLVKDLKPCSDLDILFEPLYTFFNTNRAFDSSLTPSSPFSLFDKSVNFKQDIHNLGFYFLRDHNSYRLRPGVFRIPSGISDIDLAYLDNKTFIHVYDLKLQNLEFDREDITFTISVRGFLVENKEIKGALAFVIKDDVFSFLNRITNVYNDQFCFSYYFADSPSFTPSLLVKGVPCLNVPYLREEPYYYSDYLYKEDSKKYL